MRNGMVCLLGAVILPVAALAAQKAPARRCQLDVLSVDREGYYEDFQAGVNYFAGGNVRMRCRNQPVFLDGDSLASYNQEVIWLITKARYRDETIDLSADTLIYRKNDERLEMRGNVVARNLENGSTLEGPWVDYLRAVQGIRDSAEVVAQQRPTVTYRVLRAPGDSTDPAPYVVTTDGLRSRGSSWMQGWGNVEIDRDALHGRGDSVLYVRSEEDLVTLAGMPATLKQSGTDSFDVSGTHVRLGLDGEVLRQVDAFGSGRVNRGTVAVVADSVVLGFADGDLVSTRAWDHATPARVLADGFDVRGDSIAIDTPGERLRELRVFRRGVLMQPLDATELVPLPDSTGTDSLPPIRNTMTGSAIVATFADHDSAGTVVSRLTRILATGSATALFARSVIREGAPSPTINYTRGDTIIVEMHVGDSTGVREVRAYRGSQPVDGVQLERASLRPHGTALPARGTAERERRP
ncbi:MAG TPA: hypothetical protein VFN22_08440 [Gemmatimonadales bacterium]|nr:hypothetical protein [Gemmatimonadales bacterium]